MTDHNREVCFRCGAPVAHADREATSRELCPSCLVQPEITGSQDVPSEHSMPVDPDPTEVPTVFPSNIATPIFDGETVDYIPDPGATQSLKDSKELRRLSASISPLANGSEFGRFLIKGVLGRGSFGLVYRAYDSKLDREVALKVPRFAGGDEDLNAKFLHEAKAAAKLRHPNIVAVYESGEVDGQPYIAVELVEGTPLSQLLKLRRVEVRECAEWIRQISEALAYAHAEGVVHRDLRG